MTFLPLIHRDLRTRARRQGFYWMRLTVAALGVLICLPQLVISPYTTRSTFSGNHTFTGMVIMGFLLCCCACLLTAEGIGEERREGTLDLLFLTRVRFIDLLVGKFSSAGLTVLCALLTLLPLLAVPAMAGGVTGGEVARQSLALLDTLSFALSVGLVASVLFRHRVTALGGSVLIMVLLTGAPLLVWSRCPFTPLTPVLAAFDADYKRHASVYWESLALVQFFAWGLLVFAQGLLRRMARQPEKLITASETVVRQKRARSSGIEIQQLSDPIRWLVERQRGIKTIIWLTSIWLAFSSILFQWLWRTRTGPYQLFWFTSIFVSLLSDGFYVWCASRFFLESRRNGALELLLTTPSGAAGIIFGQWRALKSLFFWPVLFMMTVMFVRIAYRGVSVDTMIYFVNVVLAVGAICWTGLWFGWKAKGAASAIAWSLLVAKIGPMVLLWSGSLLTMAFSYLGSRLDYQKVSFLMTHFNYFYTGVQLADALFYLWLMRHFRNKLFRALVLKENMNL